MQSAFRPSSSATFGGALFLSTSEMAPTLPSCSVAFLGRQNHWRGDGLYALADGTSPGVPAFVCRGQSLPEGICISLDSNPDGAQVLGREEMEALGFWPVVGAAQPFAEDFGQFLLERFSGGSQ